MRRASFLFVAASAIGLSFTTFANAATAHETHHTTATSSSGSTAAAPSYTDNSQQIADASRARDRILADLYARYGGGETSRHLQRENEGTGTGTSGSTTRDWARTFGDDVKQGAGKVVADIDRATFDAQCRRIGHGQKPILPSDRQSTFFTQADVIDRCNDVARLDLRIDQLRGRE